MSVEREMSLAEWCAKLPNQHKVNQELAVLNKQLAALAEQNEKMREALIDTAYFLEQHSNRWDGIKGKHPNDVVEAARNALSSPDLATPVLNRIRAEGMRMAADICSEKHSLSGAEEAIRARADELTKGGLLP